MPDTLKKLREPAALAAVGFAGLALLVAVVNLLAPPSSDGVSEPFANRAYDQVTSFLDVVVAAAAVYAVYLANHVSPALPKARLITMAALGEAGVAVLFGVVTALAQFGVDGVSFEGKFLHFLAAIGAGAVVAVAALYVWITWQALAPAAPRGVGQQPLGGQYGGGAGWSGAPGGSAGGQQYPPQPQGPPPGGFGWSPQQQPAAPGQPGFGGQPGQTSPTPFGQQQGAPGQGQAQGQGQNPAHAQGQSGYGALPGQGQPAQSGYGQPDFGQPDFGQPGAPASPQQFGSDRTQLLPPVPPAQPGQQGQPGGGQPGGYGQQSQSFGLPGGAGLSTGSHQPQPQPPLPPTMQDYAAEPSPWSPGGPANTGGGGAVGGQQPSSQEYPDEEQRPGNPFPIGEWRSE